MKHATLYYRIMTFCCACFLASSAWAAQKDSTLLIGTVKDAFTRKPIEGAEIALLRPDSTVLYVVRNKLSANKGMEGRTIRFSMKVPEQTEHQFLLRLTHPNYQTVYKPVNLVWRKKEAILAFWDLTMRALVKGQDLDEVTVTATKIKFYNKGDTLVYNADAFQLQNGSMLDALIAQLPGAKLYPDGRIMVKGKFIESLLLNGRDFFKGDNTVLLDNLPAYMVKSLQVYNKESEESKLVGTKVDEGQYVMDVRLKREYSIGWLANAEAGLGTSDRYLGRLFAMRYTPQSRISAFGNLNNVNDRRKPDGNGGWGEFDPTGGLTTGKRAGIDYSIYDKRDRFQLSGSAEVNYSDNENAMGGSSSDFYESGDVHDKIENYSKSSNFSLSTNHNFRIWLNKDSKKVGGSYRISPSFNYYKNDQNGFNRSGTFNTLPSGGYEEVLDSLFSPDWTKTLRGVIKRNRQQAMSNGHGSSGRLYLFRFFNIPYTSDGVSVDGSISYSNSKSYNYNHFLYNYYEGGALQTDYRNRYKSNPTDNFNYNVGTKLIKHFGDEIMFNPSYDFYYRYTAGDEQHYRLDVLGDESDQPLGWLPSQAEALLKALDADNSYKGRLHSYSHIPTLDFQWNHYERDEEGKEYSSWYIQVRPGLTFQKVDYLFMATPRDQQVNKNYVSPFATIKIKRNTPGYKHRLEFSADFKSHVPSMTNLVDKTFAANPLNITVGNPDLKGGSELKAYFTYASDKWMEEKERQLTGTLGYSMTHNAIGMTYTYNRETGVTTNRPENVNGNWYTWLNLYYTTPLDKKRRFTLSSSTQPRYYRNADFVSDQASVTPQRTIRKTVTVEEFLNLNYRYKKVNVSVKGEVAWMHGTSDMAAFTTVNTWNFRYGPSAVIDLPASFQLSTELTMFSRRGYETAEVNRNDLVWNARLSKSVLGSRLTFMLDAYDILGNLSNMVYGLNSRSRWEYYYNVIPRYGLLRVAYKFSKQPKKKR